MTLFSFLEESVTPWHAARALARRLDEAGFTALAEADVWVLKPGQGYYTLRGGAVAAWVAGGSQRGWTVAAAHTDSPGWKLKTASARVERGITRIGTEVYGGPIHSTWFDRPLAIAGRVFIRGAKGPREVLVRTEPLGVFPNLAIHYNREVNKGFAYDATEHLSLLASLGTRTLIETLAERAGFAPTDWLSGDLFAINPAAPAELGGGFFIAPRIDNLTGCHAVIEGLLASKAPHRMAVCFDHEEIGSSTAEGADSAWLGTLLDRIDGALGTAAEDRYRSRAASFLLSVDSAHGVHPNWAGLHDEAYAPKLGQGPVLKASARFSYTTSASSEARVRLASEVAGINLQNFVMKSTLTPGSTVGPLASSWTGLDGADTGIPIWAMHSAAETAHAADQEAMVKLVASVFGR
jgi:aspartyl aminopeptidase